MTAERAVLYVKKVDVFRGILLSKQFIDYKKYYFDVYEFAEE